MVFTFGRQEWDQHLRERETGDQEDKLGQRARSEERISRNADAEPRHDIPRHQNREHGITDRQCCECKTQPNQMEISRLELLGNDLEALKRSHRKLIPPAPSTTMSTQNG